MVAIFTIIRITVESSHTWLRSSRALDFNSIALLLLELPLLISHRLQIQFRGLLKYFYRICKFSCAMDSSRRSNTVTNSSESPSNEEKPIFKFVGDVVDDISKFFSTLSEGTRQRLLGTHGYFLCYLLFLFLRPIGSHARPFSVGKRGGIGKM